MLSRRKHFLYNSHLALNQQFVSDLVTLRNLYQLQQSEMEREKAHAMQQLSHVNALLVDEIVENQRFVESLIELRNHYQGVLQECDRKADHAKELLTHVNALLADQLVLQHNQQPVSIQASTVSESPALTEAGDISTQESPTQEDELDQGAGAVEVDEAEEANSGRIQQLGEGGDLGDLGDLGDKGKHSLSSKSSLSPLSHLLHPLPHPDDALANEVEEVDLQQEVDELGEVAQPNEPEESNDASSHSESVSPSTTSDVAQSHPDPDSDKSVNGQPPKNQFPPLKTPMLPQYENLTKFQAVESILREKAGSILHIDWIIRALHGELAEDDVRAERGRMSQTLSHGVKKELWDKVPGESGCYTIDLELVDPSLAQKENKLVGKR